MLSAAAITRLSLSGLLALAPWAVGAQVASQIGAARAAALADQPDDAAGLPPMPMGAGGMAPMPRNVKKLGDGELSCAQIYAETQVLEKTSQERGAEAEQAQAAMMASQNEMMKQASGGMGGGGVGSSVGSSLLSLIPGGGQIQSFAMQAAADARRASMQDSVEKMMQVQTRLVNAEQARELAQARSEHLTDLFLKKGCKLSEVKSAGAAAAP
ncbi:MAG: hypothetical protein ACT6UH_13065 [Hydrogenophaga sp.]|uniref:hypothetical protein n=1 Tax=Hydrogenophaga sp. TaxID=1904254 RepID=UPI0040361C7B